jgi:hypothetical protein
VGRGYQPHEFRGYGVDQTKSRAFQRSHRDHPTGMDSGARQLPWGPFQLYRRAGTPQAGAEAASASVDGSTQPRKLRAGRTQRLQSPLRPSVRLLRCVCRRESASV